VCTAISDWSPLKARKRLSNNKTAFLDILAVERLRIPHHTWSSYDRIWFSRPDKQEIFI
jgi:hypothetical protein